MKTLVLYNIQAGKGRIDHHVEDIEAVFRREGHDVRAKRIIFGENPLLGAEDSDLVVICGGDGTINYVVNKMRELRLNPTLGIIPSGTANDFAGALGMRRNKIKAARQIARGRERMVDCGCANGQYFVNVFSFGVFTTTSQHTPDKAKHRFGKLAYLGVGIKDLFTPHRIGLRLTDDEHTFDCEALMFLAFNGETAGRFPLAREASVDDGLLDVLILERHNFFATCFNMVSHLLGGRPRAVRHLRCANLHIEASRQEPTDVDGQPGPTFPITIRCEAGALRVRC